MASAEWELLEEKEWDDAQDSVQPPQESHVAQEQDLGLDRSSSDYTTIAGTSPSGKGESRPEDSNEQPAPGRLKGASGWTKLRSR